MSAKGWKAKQQQPQNVCLLRAGACYDEACKGDGKGVSLEVGEQIEIVWL